jgi:hypothetical protein
MSDKLPVYISLGAGVQSSTMALMASRNELPDSDLVQGAIFADTQDEPQSVYTWLNWLEKQLRFPVHRVTAGKLSDKALEMRVSAKGKLYPKVSIPFHVLDADGNRTIVTHRNCTLEFKIKPILKQLKTLIKLKRGTKEPVVCQWIGISTDEYGRMKPSRDKWIKSEWPLINARMSRRSCLEWLDKNNFPTPPKSACVYCPYKDAKQFRLMQINSPHDFQKAVDFEKRFNQSRSNKDASKCQYFVYRSAKPLDSIDFRSDIERGQNLLFDDNWNDECEGMCGV